MNKKWKTLGIAGGVIFFVVLTWLTWIVNSDHPPVQDAWIMPVILILGIAIEYLLFATVRKAKANPTWAKNLFFISLAFVVAGGVAVLPPLFVLGPLEWHSSWNLTTVGIVIPILAGGGLLYFMTKYAKPPSEEKET